MELQDCIIIGGGPAGLNAAVVLGRCQRKILIFDTQQYRNLYSHGMHNYLTRDDILPSGFLNLCHAEVAKYGGKIINKKVVSGRKNEEGLFVVSDEDGTAYHAKKLLVATGLSDKVPDVPGFRQMYGKSVHHCPYCDGWEVRNKKLAVYAKDKEGWELALNLKAWSNDVIYLTDGGNKIKPSQKAYLEANAITINKEKLVRLEGENGQLKNIVFQKGKTIACEALFFVNGFTPQCNLAETFGCNMTRKGVVITNLAQQTNIPGLYVAGDAARDMHFVVVAAAEGAKAGVSINKELQKEISEQRLKEAGTNKSH
ncbi:MAG: NAD(P)/FAD-dependent oxidoreductase [Flaviaesturariibacter sp.]|nr:NAD(P)/FAD-dependent oxidoreductase [Flaviaesturariibacter sp.]